MRLESDEAIAQLLVQAKRIALVGASAKPERPSHRVMQFLLDEGYEVFPINPGLAGQKLLGQTVYASLAALPTRVDMADIFRDAASLPEVTQEVVDAGIPAIWTQLGVVHSEAERTAVDAGLQVVVDRCPAIEIPRLRDAGLIPSRPLQS
ncbi:MAG: CoA-binding protein [Halieaceae bacterium]|jgi:predicted CoA-binding protein|nr:MAG: CoA-binding protein [Halieaceae bacterium]|tara:strand:- start:472 stop:921 length:450 start_codon:yes stop_codon:yes gene_type:complete